MWLTARLFIQSVSGDGATLVRLCVSIISSPHSYPSYVVMHQVWCILKKQKTKNCTDPFSTATHLLVAVFFSFFFLNLSVKTHLPAESRNKKQVWATTNGSLHKNRAPLALTVLKELAGNVWSQNWFFFFPYSDVRRCSSASQPAVIRPQSWCHRVRAAWLTYLGWLSNFWHQCNSLFSRGHFHFDNQYFVAHSPNTSWQLEIPADIVQT